MADEQHMTTSSFCDLRVVINQKWWASPLPLWPRKNEVHEKNSCGPSWIIPEDPFREETKEDPSPRRRAAVHKVYHRYRKKSVFSWSQDGDFFVQPLLIMKTSPLIIMVRILHLSTRSHYLCSYILTLLIKKMTWPIEGERKKAPQKLHDLWKRLIKLY